MCDSFQIIAADPQPEMRRFYQEMLPRMGHELVGMVETGQDLVQRCRRLHPDLVISDVRLLDMDAVEAAARICADSAVPMIILTARHPSGLVAPRVDDGVLTFLIKPVSRARLGAEIPPAVHRFRA